MFFSVPGPIDSLEAIQIGSNAFYMTWKRPKYPNGKLIGYRIFGQEVHDSYNGLEFERELFINNSFITRAKFSSLRSGTKYRLSVRAVTSVSKDVK